MSRAPAPSDVARYGVLDFVFDPFLALSAARVLSAIRMLSARRMLSRSATESTAIGAGAMAGVVVSVAGVSFLAHAAAATTTATRARRFMESPIMVVSEAVTNVLRERLKSAKTGPEPRLAEIGVSE